MTASVVKSADLQSGPKFVVKTAVFRPGQFGSDRLSLTPKVRAIFGLPRYPLRRLTEYLGGVRLTPPLRTCDANRSSLKTAKNNHQG